MSSVHAGLIAMTPDELLTALVEARARVEELERFRSNVASVIDGWNANDRGDESACHAIAFCVREVSP